MPQECAHSGADIRTAQVTTLIFEGGATWRNSNFPLVALGSGTGGNDDFYGVDPTWYEGSRFRPPDFDAGAENITGTDSNEPGPNDIFIDLRNQDYIEVADIKFTGFTASDLSTSFGTCAVINASDGGLGSVDQHITIDRINVPEMNVDAQSWGGDTNHSGPGCFAVGGANSSHSVVENSTFATTDKSYAGAISSGANVENNTINGFIDGILLGHGDDGVSTSQTISGNLIENCGLPRNGSIGIHANAIEAVGNQYGAQYIYDNVIDGTGFDPNGAGSPECEAMLLGPTNSQSSSASETYYVWNNVALRLGGHVFGRRSRGVGVIGRIPSGRTESCVRACCGCGADRSGGW